MVLAHNLAANPPRAARSYLLPNVAAYDAAVGCWDAKYTYWAPRPFQLDPNFKPLFTTPNHPSYPSAHGCISTALGATMAYLFPADAQTVEALAENASQSRIWAGIHFRSDVAAGQALGAAVAQKFIQRAEADGSN
jgi:membrane-associated phospholipid phosphatase